VSRHRPSVVVTLLAALVLASPSLAAAPSGVTRIYNGAQTAEYPAVGFVAVVLADGQLGFCSGTLIAPDVVLTAAHCLEGPVLDAGFFLYPGGVERFHQGIATLQHEEYRPDVAAFADIGILYLEEPVTDVAPMAWATTMPRPRTRAAIVGFGDDGHGNGGVKRVGEVRVKKCPKVFRKAGIQKGQLVTSICWKPKPRKSDTCRGDSGGPLVVDGVVAGLTSGGFPNCPGKLSWDTNVALFAPWIEAAIALPRDFQ
jgi:hypothetical protein